MKTNKQISTVDAVHNLQAAFKNLSDSIIKEGLPFFNKVNDCFLKLQNKKRK